MTDHSTEPTDDDRRRAVCLAMGRATVLIRYARRYVPCLDDAEDAYQRAMEIALTKAPVTEPARFLAWLYTVVRNEAIAVAKERARQGLGRAEDVAERADGEPNGQSPERSAEWRERYRGVQDALGSLSNQQRSCLMLQSAGMSYEQIAAATGLSHRQIERAISRGRSRLHAWEDKLESGAACEELRPALERVVARQAARAEVRRVARHVRACVACRASMRRRLATTETLAALVPLAVIADASALSPPDPGLVLAYWERLAAAGMARTGQLLTAALELPSAGLGRAGGAVAALALAGLAVLPMATEALPGGARHDVGAEPSTRTTAAAPWPSALVLAAAQAAVASATSATTVTPPAPRPRSSPITEQRRPEPSAAQPASRRVRSAPVPAPTRARPATPRPLVGTPAGEFAP